MFDTYEKKKGFPEPRVLYNYLAQCEIKHYDISKDEGSLVLITLPTGIQYNFTVSGIGRSLGTIKQEIVDKYGDCKIEMFPKGTVIIGNQIIEP
jgi:hypothetical protein